MLAILIPYYKLTFFESTLNSLAFQNDKRFKVYIGDDASPENPDILLQKYKGEFDFVYHRFDNNLGRESLTKQWQRCLDLITDTQINWLVILGDDDLLNIDFVGAFYNNIEQINKFAVNVIRYASQEIDYHGSISSKVFLNPTFENCSEYLLRRNKRSSLSEYVFNFALIRTVGFQNFPLGWYSDNALILEVSGFNLIYSINESIVFVRVSEISISGRKDLTIEKNKARNLFYLFLLRNLLLFDDPNSIYEFIKKYFFYGRNKLNYKLCYGLLKHNLINFNFIGFIKFVGGLIYTIFGDFIRKYLKQNDFKDK